MPKVLTVGSISPVSTRLKRNQVDLKRSVVRVASVAMLGKQSPIHEVADKRTAAILAQPKKLRDIRYGSLSALRDKRDDACFSIGCYRLPSVVANSPLAAS